MFFLMWFKKRREDKRHHLCVKFFVENELRDLLKPFPKARLECRHEMNYSLFLIHQKRGEGEEEMFSFAWIKITWRPEIVEFSTREMRPKDPLKCSTDEICDAVRKIMAFVERYNTAGTFAITIRE